MADKRFTNLNNYSKIHSHYLITSYKITYTVDKMMRLITANFGDNSYRQ